MPSIDVALRYHAGSFGRRTAQVYMRGVRSHRGTDGRASQHCRARGVIAVSFEMRFGLATCLQNRSTITHEPSVTHVKIARRMSWQKANKKVIESLRNQKRKRSKPLLQRRAKRAQRRVGSRRSDRAKRSRHQAGSSKKSIEDAVQNVTNHFRLHRISSALGGSTTLSAPVMLGRSVVCKPMLSAPRALSIFLAIRLE